MRILLLLPAIVLPFVSASACGGVVSTTSGAGGSTGTSTCLGGCDMPPITVGTLTLQVVDGMGQPVADPTFTEGGQTLNFGGSANDAGYCLSDAGPCGLWSTGLESGSHTITVGAPGYEPTTVTVLVPLSQSNYCFPCDCLPGYCEATYTVTLQPSPADAGAD
jgi:hypothetical protein